MAFEDILRAAGYTPSQPQGGNAGGGYQAPSGGPAFNQMLSYMPQVQQANQAYQIDMGNNPYQQQGGWQQVHLRHEQPAHRQLLHPRTDFPRLSGQETD